MTKGMEMIRCALLMWVRIEVGCNFIDNCMLETTKFL